MAERYIVEGHMSRRNLKSRLNRAMAEWDMARFIIERFRTDRYVAEGHMVERYMALRLFIIYFFANGYTIKEPWRLFT